MKVKIISGTSISDTETKTNAFLATMTLDQVVSIQYSTSQYGTQVSSSVLIYYRG